MGFFHLRSPEGTAWPPIPAGEVGQVWAAYQELDRTQWLTHDELEKLQFRQIRALMLHCQQNVPYYARLLSKAGLDPRLLDNIEHFRRIPLMTRELYQAHFADLQARALPAGMSPAGGSYTSGTSGVPIKVLKTNRDALWWSAMYLRDLEWSGLDPRGRLAAIRLMAMKRDDLPQAKKGFTLPYWTPFTELLLESGPSFGMDVRQDPPRQIEWLREINPDYLLSLPSNLEYLASLLQETGEKLPSLRAIQAVGEPVPIATRQRIEGGFGVPVKNLYSTTETGYVASPCPLGHGLHVHAENVLAEVLDDNDQPCAPGQTGRLVLTSLTNFLTPFVRYDILDDVTLGTGPCPCGRGLPLWTHVDGRRHPMLYLPDGERRSVIGIVLGLRQVGGCRQFQIIQRSPEHVVLRVVPDRSWSVGHAERMRQCVRNEMDAEVRVDVDEYEVLERPAGGKLKIAVVEMEEELCPV